jgi:hypothetical protein
MEVTLNSSVLEAINGVDPEPIREHWVVVAGRRYPPKQVYQLVTGLPRSAFTSHRALAELRKLGLSTSVYVPPRAVAARPEPSRGSDLTSSSDGLAESFATLSRFLADNDLTARLAAAEAAFHRWIGCES